MITTFIVVTSIVLAAVFTIVWLAKPGLRRHVEAPKHLFAAQIRQYDEQNRESRKTAGAQSNDGT